MNKTRFHPEDADNPVGTGVLAPKPGRWSSCDGLRSVTTARREGLLEEELPESLRTDHPVRFMFDLKMLFQAR